FAGYQMVSLHSQAGNTIAEAFDQYMGIFSFGMSLLSITVALPPSLPTPAPVTAAGNLPHPTQSAPSPTQDLVAVEGWDPDGARVCPSCGRPVSPRRTTHCEHCGFQLVRRQTTGSA